MRKILSAVLALCCFAMVHAQYLKPVKVGNKVRYRQSDIQKILGERNPSI